jgi:Ni/Fe-hydrogenase subunit HybB-like protein
MIFPETEIKQKKGTLILYCLTGIVIPNLIISFTPKYTEWTERGSYAYVTSFYSYFFLITLFILVLKCIIKKNSRIATVSASILVFALSLVSAVNNAAWNCYFRGEFARYKAFSDAVSSDYFDTLADGTTVYIPDYTGIHHDMSVTESFVSIYTDADLTFTNDPENIDFSRPAIMMKYDPEQQIINCGKMDQDMNFFVDFHT